MAFERIPVVLCIDVEPDERAPALRPLSHWTGLDGTFPLVERVRARLQDATGEAVHFSWFLRMDPQIKTLQGDAGWVAHRYAAELARVGAAGDAIGVHPHPWRWDDSEATWINDLGDAEWVDECVRSSFAEYAAVFGSQSEIHRFGDHSMDDRTLAVVEECGGRYDLTIEPGTRGRRLREHGARVTGELPDQSRAPRAPYRPSVADHLLPGADGDARTIWMLPLTSTDTSSAMSWPRRAVRRIRWPRRPPFRQVTLTDDIRPETLWSWIERDLAAGTPSLVFAIRSDLSMRPRLLGSFEAKLEHLIRLPLLKSLRFTTPGSAVDASAHSP